MVERVIAALLRLGSRDLGSGYKMSRLTLTDKCLNFLLQLEAIFNIVTMVTMVSVIFVLVLSSKGALQRLGPF